MNCDLKHLRYKVSGRTKSEREKNFDQTILVESGRNPSYMYSWPQVKALDNSNAVIFLNTLIIDFY